MSNDPKDAVQKDQDLFDFKVEKNKKQTVKIADIELVPGYENEEYMTNSITDLGLLDDNIYLVKKGNRLKVIDGKRRLMAMKAQGEKTVNAFVFKSIDDYKGAMVTLATNNARSNNPTAELEAIEILMKRGVKPATIRKYANVSKSKISKLQSLHKLERDLYQALRKNRITFTMAYEISKLDKASQKKLVKIYRENECLTGEDLQSIKTKKKETMAAEMPDELFEELTVDPVERVFNLYAKLSVPDMQRFLKRIKLDI